MNAKIMIALVAFTAVFAGCLVMADVSDAADEPSTATIHYQDDKGKDLLIVPFETDANGKVYTVLTWADVGATAPEGKEFTKWMEVSIVEDPETTETTKEANTNYLLKTGDTLTLRADFSFETYTVTVMDGETIVGTYTASVTEVEKKIKYPALGTFAYGETEEMTYLKDFEMEDTDSKQFKGLDITLDTEITADTIVNVVWTPIYKVTWMVGDFIVSEGTTRTVDGKMELNIPEIPSKANFDFKGWKVGDVLVAHDSVEDFEFTRDTVFVAEFTPSSLSVTFMDGEKVVRKVTVLYGDCISADKIPVGYDWDFDFTKSIVENTVIGLKAVEPVPEPEPASEPDNTTTYVLVALFGVLIIAGLILGIRQLKK